MKIERRNSGTCSRSIRFDIDDQHFVSGIVFEGGCSGNLKGIAALCEGKKAEEIIQRCKGIRCGFKTTSCPDQLALALEKAIEELSAVKA